jgi:hypothetical protein
MDKEFLRMQQLAGIPDINIDNNSFQKITLGYITELYLLKKYYSKGILKENLSKNEIILIESKLTNWLLKTGIKPTEAFIASLFNKFEKLARKLGIEDPLEYLESLRDKTLKKGEEEINENAFRNFMNKTFYKDKESGNLVSTPEKVNIKALGLLGTYILGLMLNINIGFEKLKELSLKTDKKSFDTELILKSMSDKNQSIAQSTAKELGDDTYNATFSQDDPLKNPVITSDSLNAVDVEFPTGEFELDADLEKELVNKLVDNIKKTISSNKNIDSLTIEYGGSIDDIGSDTGNEDNPDGPDKDGLKDLRTGVGKNIADKAIKILEPSFKDVKFNAEEFDNKDNKAGIGFDLESTEKKETKKSKLPQTFISPRKEKTEDLPTDKPLPKPPVTGTDEPLGTTDPKPEEKSGIDSAPLIDTGRDITNIANLNRNSQIAFVLAKTNNKLNLYRQLGIKNIINIPDGEFNNIATKGEYNGKPVTPQAKLLAQNVIRSRKSPNTFINAYAKITGTNRGGNRRKASITTGAKGKSSSAPIKENEISSIDLLEASIDKILADNSRQTTFKQKAFLAKLINVIYYGEEGKDVLDIESSTDDRFKKEYEEIKSPLGSQEKGERYVYLDKLQTPDKYDITVIKNLFSKIPQLSILLNKINTKAELADFILALFLHTNEQGSSLFSDKKRFANNQGKVRSALFGLNNRIPNTLQEILFGEAEETPETPDTKLFDVEKFYKILDTKPTILAKLKNIDNIEEFYQFCLDIIFPSLNDTFKTKSGVSQIKQAIALAANSSTKYKSILDAKPKPVNEEFYRMQQLAGLI